MLPTIDQESSVPNPAKIIDLGLAHLKDIQTGDGRPSPGPQPPSGCQESFSKGKSPNDVGDSLPPETRAPRAHHHITVSPSLAAAPNLPNGVPPLRERSPLLPWT